MESGSGRSLAESFPVGVFLIDRERQWVTLNQRLRELLGVAPAAEGMGYPEFIDRLCARSDAPQKTRLDLKKAFRSTQGCPSLNIPLRGQRGGVYKLIVSNPIDPAPSGQLAGVLVDISPDLGQYNRRLAIFEDLLLQVRKSSAAAGGSIQALSANLHSWGKELLAEFAGSTSQEIAALNQTLDLALIFARTISSQEVFPEVVDLRGFLQGLLADRSQHDFRLLEAESSSAGKLSVQLDPALSRLAFLFLLDAVARRSHPEHSGEISLELEGDLIRVSIHSGRMLPLPGLSESAAELLPEELDPALYLAEVIFQSQGCELMVESIPAQQGSGLQVRIGLPAGPDQRELRPAPASGAIEFQEPGRILLAEAQAEYQVLLQKALRDLGFRVDLALEGNAALDLVQRVNPDAVIIERNLPGLDGMLVTQGIRRWSNVPVIMLSSRLGGDDLVQAYQAGVDDYLRKPFQVEELLLRLRASIRRYRGSRSREGGEIYQGGDIRIDYASRQVWRKGSPLHLTPIEYNLLAYMTRQGKQIMTYEQLLDRVWEGPEKGSRQGLFVHIKRLREKIESDPKHPQIIRNKWGVGYEFNP